jgi:hypothetical protein
MKDWQHGYEIEYLKELAAKYDHYNSFTYSPFAQVKKNNIAEGLHQKTLIHLLDDTVLSIKHVKAKGNITMHGDTIIGVKQKGDVVFSDMVGDPEILKLEIIKYNQDAWMYVWAEDKVMNDFAVSLNFCKVGPKITTFGEMYMIYYRGKPRQFPKFDIAELQSICKLSDVDLKLINKIHDKLNLLPEFTNHYSNYNKGKSWSALSLRGYTDDPSFITKPIEMSDKWKEEHKEVDFHLQDTPLFQHFSEVRELLKPFGQTLHRVRFMRLKPGGGELERHTDQVDPDSGGSIGKLARLHFPIKTNKDVIFTVCHTDGTERKVHMKEGECWFLDTRKPHQAINGGTEERIHLVVDVLTEKELHDRIVERLGRP